MLLKQFLLLGMHLELPVLINSYLLGQFKYQLPTKLFSDFPKYKRMLLPLQSHRAFSVPPNLNVCTCMCIICEIYSMQYIEHILQYIIYVVLIKLFLILMHKHVYNLMEASRKLRRKLKCII